MSTDKYRISELERKLANLILVGRVDEVDAARGCRVKIGELLTTWLPAASVRQGIVKTRAPLKVGEVVLVISHNGDLAQGFVVGSLGDSLGDWRVLCDDGTEIGYTPETKALVVSSAGTLTATATVSAKLEAPIIHLNGSIFINGTPLVAGGDSF